MIRYGVIGCGKRAVNLLRMLSTDVELVAGWDPDAAKVDALYALAAPGRDLPHPASWQALLLLREVDWVFVCSPNAFHRAHIEAALSLGKHVFAEKPLATSEEDCLALAHAAAASDRLLMTGFTLRYSPLYREVKRVIAAGTLGRVVSIDANENLAPGHGAYIFTNWRRDHSLAGGHILEKCVHDLDLLGWFTASRPIRVAAFGGNAMFTPDNAPLFDKALSFLDWEETRATGLNPFTTDKTIEDTLVAILEYESGARVQFQLTSSNALGERRMFISGTEGTLIVDLVKARLTYQTLYDSAPTVWDGGEGFHGGGDEVMLTELAATMLHSTPPATGITEGLTSTLVGLSLDRARRKGQVLDLMPLWGRLDAAK